MNGSVIIVCIAGVPGGPNGVETPICYAQDKLFGDCPHLEQLLLHTQSVSKKKGTDHTALDQRKCSLPKVATRKVLDGSVRTDSLLKQGGDTADLIS